MGVKFLGFTEEPEALAQWLNEWFEMTDLKDTDRWLSGACLMTWDPHL